MSVARADAEMVVAAIEIHRRHPFSLWHALIVQAALVGGCGRLPWRQRKGPVQRKLNRAFKWWT